MVWVEGRDVPAPRYRGVPDKIAADGAEVLPRLPGWAIAEAGSGFQALEILRQHAFALAIVDLSMPGLNGLDLIHRIKADFPKVAVLVLSMHA